MAIVVCGDGRVWNVFLMRGAVFPLLILVLMSTVGAAGARAQELLSRTERCIRLHEQLDAALRSSRGEGSASAELESLRNKGADLCARGKVSQGVRTLAKALEMVGSVPFDEPVRGAQGRRN